MTEKRYDPGYQVGATITGSALFIDVRKSSRIIDFVERHHGPEAATHLFMNFLVGVMAVVDGPAVDECSPSGDAVLALFTGAARKSEAIDAAHRALAFVRFEFARENKKYLTCTGQCERRDCPVVEFQVGIGLDDGEVTDAVVAAGRHRSRQLVGACISFASKLSGAAPPDSIVVSTSMSHREHALADKYRWKHDHVLVGTKATRVVLIPPPT